MEMCDMCGKKAIYDARIEKNGVWAYLCESCFMIYGVRLGIGWGSVLNVKNEGGEEE